MTAAEKLTRLVEVLEAGHTVIISTYLRAVKVTKKHLKTEPPLFKVFENSLFLRRGKSYGCVDYCRFVTLKED